jgi:hypothetical protein
MNDWVEELPAEVTVCGTLGTIHEMNSEAERLFAADGGAGLLGTNVLDCHPEPYRTRLTALMDKQIMNAYFNTEDGEKRFFFQSPWFENDHYAGFVEISFTVPGDIPHFKRG